MCKLLVFLKATCQFLQQNSEADHHPMIQKSWLAVFVNEEPQVVYNKHHTVLIITENTDEFGH